MSDDYRPSIACALKGMFSFYTMLPINIEKKHMDDMNRCFWLAPVVGLFYGLMAAVIFCLVSKYISNTIAAALTLFAIGLMNRFLHLDGTVDIGDGLTVAGKREDHVRALKDTLVGAGGVIMGIMVIMLTFAEYSSINYVPFLFIGTSAEVLAKNAQVSAAAFGIPGNGMAGDSVRFSDWKSLVKSSVLSAVFMAAIYFAAAALTKEVFGGEVFDAYWIGMMIAFVLSVVWGYFMSKVAERNFGMVNGDVLGAVNETGRAVVVLAMIAVLTIMTRL